MEEDNSEIIIENNNDNDNIIIENIRFSDKINNIFINLKEKQNRRKLFYLFLFIIILIIIGIILFISVYIFTGNNGDNTDNIIRSITVKNGGVAGDCKLCAQVGREILENLKGNAVDAAVAATLCVGVAQPFASGIGGGCVINVFMKDEGKSLILDSREKAPRLATTDMYIGREINSTHGALSIGVPGELKGLYEIWNKYGSLEWKELVEPSISIAQSTEITELDVLELEDVGFDIINEWEGLKEIYIKNGEFVKEGDIISRPKLADTLTTIANEGQSAFYNGELGETIAEEIINAGGLIDIYDLRNYSTIWRDSISIPYNYNTIHVAPPPFSGIVMGFAMNILEYDELVKDNIDSLHLIIEAWKWAFGDRLSLGDPDFVDIDNIIKIMTSKDHAIDIRSKINLSRTYSKEYYSDIVEITDTSKILEDHGTMHLNTVDKYGNMVAITSTVNLDWGSKFVGPKTGIVFNNNMDDFATPNFTNHFGVPPSEANYIYPNKRPLSSMNPVIISSNNEPFLAVGASGGTKIITAVMQTIINVLSFKMEPGDAVINPRLHDQLDPEVLYAEDLYNDDILNKLEEKGHNVSHEKRILGCSSLIVISEDNNRILASDWRKRGEPDGY